jgi:hypothetical protein
VKWFFSTAGITVSLTALGFLYGAAWVYFSHVGDAPQIVVVFGILMTATVFEWMRQDAYARSFKRSPIMNVAVIALPVVTVPVYLFRTRGLRGGMLGTAVALTIFLISWLSSWVGGALVSWWRT